MGKVKYIYKSVEGVLIKARVTRETTKYYYYDASKLSPFADLFMSSGKGKSPFSTRKDYVSTTAKDAIEAERAIIKQSIAILEKRMAEKMEVLKRLETYKMEWCYICGKGPIDCYECIECMRAICKTCAEKALDYNQVCEKCKGGLN